MFDGPAFDEWLKKGTDRSPLLYGGRVVHPVSAPVPAPQAKPWTPSAPLPATVVKRDEKQNVADHDDDPLDGIELVKEG
jgi:hypothetical protein